MSRELDRLLCERLGIEADAWMLDGVKLPLANCRALQKANPNNQWVLEAVYPALSTTGNGMVTLMEALRDQYDVTIVIYDEARWVATVIDDQQVRCRDGVHKSAPTALALAAAAALGIEVPND